MTARIIGIILAVLGIVISISYKPILNKVFRITEITDAYAVRVKLVGLLFAIAGAVVVFTLG